MYRTTRQMLAVCGRLALACVVACMYVDRATHEPVHGLMLRDLYLHSQSVCMTVLTLWG